MDIGYLVLIAVWAPLFGSALFSAVWIGLKRIEQSQTFRFFVHCIAVGGILSGVSTGVLVGSQLGVASGIWVLVLAAVMSITVAAGVLRLSKLTETASEKVARLDRTGIWRRRVGRTLLVLTLLWVAYTLWLRILGIE